MIELNKPQSQREIKIAIENLYGIDSMVYAQFKAFETIVREQILLLKEPVLTCVELVIAELNKGVRAVLTGRVCTNNFLNYKLRTEFKIYYGISFRVFSWMNIPHSVTQLKTSSLISSIQIRNDAPKAFWN